MKTWKVFIHCHNVIWDEMVENDPDFTSEHYSFLKLGRHDLRYNPKKGYHIISEFDYPIHWDAPHYAELTGMYCVYKNRLHDRLDYVGFSHYDKEHRLLCPGGCANINELETARVLYDGKRRKSHGPTDVTARINSIIGSPVPVHVSLESHDFQKIYDQRVLMDDTKPDAFIGEGVNCIDRILDDYNSFFQTRHSLQDVARDGFLTMCDCFITPACVFDKLMSFIAPIMESGKLDRYDTQRLHRLQGGLLERYVAVFFALEDIVKIDLSTVHQVSKKLKQPKKWRFYEFRSRKTD
ncbi:MAG TPA: hypothetical protein VFG28_12740 [Syntrophales bacterium]|nr:hypothetical protein [Syntrophales bacterium]